MVRTCFVLACYHVHSSPQGLLTDGHHSNLRLVVVDSVYDIAAPLLGEREVEGKLNIP